MRRFSERATKLWKRAFSNPYEDTADAFERFLVERGILIQGAPEVIHFHRT
jgi:hypothetical protein